MDRLGIFLCSGCGTKAADTTIGAPDKNIPANANRLCRPVLTAHRHMLKCFIVQKGVLWNMVPGFSAVKKDRY